MKIHYSPGPVESNRLGTAELRDAFLLTELFRPGEVIAHYTDLDRMIVGGAMPNPGVPIELPQAKATGTDYFLERREIGILNLGQIGEVKVSGVSHRLETLDCLYIGKGEKEVSLESGSAGASQFYFVSTPAHAKYPTAVVRKSDVRTDPIGDSAQANRRRINKYIHVDGIRSCQLVMGLTEFDAGSVWNTMPTHTHSRRTEIYFYFDLRDQLVVHLMGEPAQTRHLIVRDRQAVLSPSWSIHSGVGTGSYRFVWAMGGDNQIFSDMDAVPMSALR